MFLDFSTILEKGGVLIALALVIYIAVAGIKANTEEHGGSKSSKNGSKVTEKKEESGENK